MFVKRRDAHIEISFPFDMALVAFVKKLEGRKYDARTKSWLIPFAGAGVSLEQLERKGFAVDHDLKEAIQADRKAAGEAVALATADDAPFESPLPLFPYQKVGAEFLYRIGSGLLGDSPGCIAGTEKVKINRGGNCRTFTIADAHRKSKGRWSKDLKSLTRSLGRNGEFGLNEINDIVYQGVKDTVEIRAKTAKKSYSLMLTPDHELLRVDGKWIEAGKLSIGEKILVNGKTLLSCPRCGGHRDIIKYDYAKFKGWCRSCMYKYERDNKWTDGGTCCDKSGYVMITGVWKHPLANKHQQRQEHIMVMEAHLNGVSKKRWTRMAKQDGFATSAVFINSKIYSVHHKNGDKADNRLKNLELLTISEHNKGHGGEFRRHLPFVVPEEARITSIRKSGRRDVYDLVMADPNRNFLANGVVVHNCGKTIMSLAVAEKAECKKVLIFCPSSVKWQWAAEIERFLYPAGAPKGEIVVVEGTRRACDLLLRDTITVRRENWQGKITTGHRKAGARFFIVNYEKLLRNFEAMDCREWDMIIADEATKISNAEAKTSKAVKRLRAKRRIPMTGTPISNRPQEMWSLLDFISPGVLGNYYAFLDRYCPKITTASGKATFIRQNQHMSELKEKIQRFMIRRKLEDVRPELPEKITTDVPIELSEEEKVFYKRIKKEILYEISQTDISKLENPMTIQFTLVKMTRLRQVANGMELLGDNKKSSKLEALKDKLAEFEGDNTKVIIFTQFSSMADILCRELAKMKPLKITGEVTGEDRQRAVEKFNNDPEHQLLISSDAGAYGLNLQAASVIIHYDQPWSLAKLLQRDGRAHRIGQKNVVQIINLLGLGTVDYYVKKVLHEKAKLAADLLGDPPILMGDIKGILEQEL